MLKVTGLGILSHETELRLCPLLGGLPPHLAQHLASFLQVLFGDLIGIEADGLSDLPAVCSIARGGLVTFPVSSVNGPVLASNIGGVPLDALGPVTCWA